MKIITFVIVSFVALVSVADGGWEQQRFLRVKYNNKWANVYGYLNDDIICVESGEQWPGIISISELSDEDAFKVEKAARKNEFRYSTPLIEEITRKFVLSNSVTAKVEFVLAERHQNYLITHLYASKEFDIKLTYVLHVRAMPAESVKSGDSLSPLHRWSVGQVLNPSGYVDSRDLRKHKDGTDMSQLSLNVSELDDAVRLLAGWMMIHKDDYYVQNTLMGIRSKQPHKEKVKLVNQRKTDESKHQDGAVEDALAVDNLRIKAYSQKWLSKKIARRGLYQYTDAVQKEYKNKLKNVENLAADIAALNTDGYGVKKMDECAKLINVFYSSDNTRAWSRLRDGCSDGVFGRPYTEEFDDKFDAILSLLQSVIPQDRDDLKKRCDDLWLNYVCHVRTWEELHAKIEAEKERERKEKEWRAEMREERKVRAEEERNAILRDINANIYDLPSRF